MPAKLFVSVQLTTKTEPTPNDLLVLDRAETGTQLVSITNCVPVSSPALNGGRPKESRSGDRRLRQKVDQSRRQLDPNCLKHPAMRISANIDEHF